jgi:hypothetical protein
MRMTAEMQPWKHSTMGEAAEIGHLRAAMS